MVDVNKLKEEELNQLKQGVNVVSEKEEVSLEELILLGVDKKIPIHIEYPLTDGTIAKGKALIKQLTMKEIDEINVNDLNYMTILKRSLFQSDGEPFPPSKIRQLPIGVVKALIDKIFEVSGVDPEELKKLQDF